MSRQPPLHDGHRVLAARGAARPPIAHEPQRLPRSLGEVAERGIGARQTLILVGLAFSLAYGALTIAATDGIAEDEQGLASGLLNVSFQFGASFGLAAATAVSVAATSAGASPEAVLDGYRAALAVPVAATVLGVIVTAFGIRSGGAPVGRPALAAESG